MKLRYVKRNLDMKTKLKYDFESSDMIPKFDDDIKLSLDDTKDNRYASRRKLLWAAHIYLMNYKTKQILPLEVWSGHFEKKVANETTHNIGVADQKILSDSNFNHFL